MLFNPFNEVYNISGDNMNNRGFTLTELIVTIAIMGIITMISYPAIDKLQISHQQDLYETYEKAIKVGAQLYVDKYSRDIFEEDRDTCVYVYFKELKSEQLVKDFRSKKNVSVNEDQTFVKISKEGKSTTVNYEVQLVMNPNVNYGKTVDINGCQNFPGEL